MAIVSGINPLSAKIAFLLIDLTCHLAGILAAKQTGVSAHLPLVGKGTLIIISKVI